MEWKHAKPGVLLGYKKSWPGWGFKMRPCVGAIDSAIVTLLDAANANIEHPVATFGNGATLALARKSNYNLITSLSETPLNIAWGVTSAQNVATLWTSCCYAAHFADNRDFGARIHQRGSPEIRLISDKCALPKINRLQGETSPKPQKLLGSPTVAPFLT